MLIDSVTELLRDGKWHYVHTLARKLDQPEVKIGNILDFCADFDIVTFDRTGNKVKIAESFKRLLPDPQVKGHHSAFGIEESSNP